MNGLRANRGLTSRLSRRWMMAALGMGLGTAFAACASPAASPTAAPAKPTAAPPTAPPPPTPAASTAPTAATAAPATPAPRATVSIGIIRGIAENLFLQVGSGAGVFDSFGITPEFVELPDAGTILKSVVARELHVGEIAASTLLSAASKDGPLRLVGASKAKLNIAMYVRPGITSLEELYGKSIGTAAPGSFFHALILSLFEAKGLDVSQVEIVNIGPSPAIFQAVANGKVDAGAATVEFIPQAERDGNPEVLFYFHEIFPLYFRQAIGMPNALLQEEPELALRVAKAWAASTRYGLDNRTEWVEQGARLYNRPVEDLAWYFDWEYQNRIPDPDLEFTQGMVDFMQRENVKSGTQDSVLPLDQVATLELQQKVVADLGKFQWKG